MFDHHLGFTELQLKLSRQHIEEARRILRTYELEITELECDVLEQKMEEVESELQKLIDVTSDDMEITHLESMYNDTSSS